MNINDYVVLYTDSDYANSIGQNFILNYHNNNIKIMFFIDYGNLGICAFVTKEGTQ